MDPVTRSPPTVVHYYDTETHRIACGLRGFESRSTKHARSVTCDACLSLLGDRTAAPAHDAAAAASP